MTTALNEQLNEVLRLRAAEPAQVLTEALEAGMQQIYLDAVIDAYLHGTLSREEAALRIGMSNVARAEEEHRWILQDVEWGLRG